MRERLAEDISVEALAELVQLSPFEIELEVAYTSPSILLRSSGVSSASA